MKKTNQAITIADEMGWQGTAEWHRKGQKLLSQTHNELKKPGRHSDGRHTATMVRLLTLEAETTIKGRPMWD